MTMRSSAWGLQSLCQQTIEIDGDEIKGLVAHPITLIAAPGKGRAVIIMGVVISLCFHTARYVDPGNAAAKVIYDKLQSAAIAEASDLHDFLLADHSQVRSFSPSGTFDWTEAEDASVLLGNFQDGGQDFQAGDGSLCLTYIYAIARL